MLTGIAIAGCVAWAILTLPYPPLQDFNETVYQALMVKLALTGNLPDTMCVAQRPTPNSAATLIIAGLMFLFSPMTAARVFLLVYVACAATISIGIARRKQPSSSWSASAVVVFTVIFVGSPFWSGYVNYMVGLLALAAFLCLSAERQASPAWIVPTSMVIFFCHALVFLPFCLLIAVRLTARRRWWALMLCLAPGAILVALYEVLPGRTDAHNDSPYGLLKLFVYKAYTAFKTGPYHNFVFADGSDVDHASALYYLGMVTNVVFGITFMVALGLGLRGLIKRSDITADTVAFLVLMVCFMALPNMALAIVNPGERFFYAALLIGIAATPMPPRLVAGLAVACACVVVVILRLPGHDFATPVNSDDVQDRGRNMFSHRPTAFADKVAAIEVATSSGHAPLAPISFETGLLYIADPVEECRLP